MVSSVLSKLVEIIFVSLILYKLIYSKLLILWILNIWVAFITDKKLKLDISRIFNEEQP